MVRCWCCDGAGVVGESGGFVVVYDASTCGGVLPYRSLCGNILISIYVNIFIYYEPIYRQVTGDYENACNKCLYHGLT